MKKRLLMILAVSVLMIGCGNTDTTDQETNNGADVQQTQQETEPQTEEETIHEHAYTESITTEATCEADGLKTFTCECGDSYTEPITAMGHSYGEYVYNNDATTSADGTETATCSTCGGTATRTKAGTKIEVSYDGYDEFGNGYVMGADGYKHFDASCPYPTYQANWTSNSEVYFYGIKGNPSISQSLKQEMAAKNGIPYDDRIKADYNYLGYYNGQLVFGCRIYIG